MEINSFDHPINLGKEFEVIHNGNGDMDLDHDEARLEHPKLEAVERLCFSYNTINDTCYVSDKNLRFTSTFIY